MPDSRNDAPVCEAAARPRAATGPLVVEQGILRGWRGLKLSANGFEMFVATDVGPRILGFNLAGRDNLLQVYEDGDAGLAPDAWHPVGGHRLWHAPEEIPRTYWPDNVPVESVVDGNAVEFLQPVEGTTRLRKSLRVEFAGNFVRVAHRIENLNPWAIEAAPWALSIVAQGGRAIFPHEEYRPHPEHLLPARPLVLWHYTDMSDPRWTWGKKYIQLRHDPALESKQKLGMLNRQEWCAYACGDQLFVKRFAHAAGATYPDFQCNCETYVCGQFLELESLGPLEKIEPGEQVEHVEIWHAAAVSVGPSEAEIDAKVLPIAMRLPVR